MSSDHMALEEDEFLYGAGEAQPEVPIQKPLAIAEDDTDNEDALSIDSSDSDDVEFILKPPAGVSYVPPPASVLRPSDNSQAPVEQPQVEPAPMAATQAPQDIEPKVKAPREQQPPLDIDAENAYKGAPITQIPVSALEDKPWRQPGADTTDYFNYGFDEFTWTAYCSKQDHLRSAYTPQKVMNGMGMQPFMMPPMMGIPGMPGMPPPMPMKNRK